jgi:hypothetical protein
LRIQCVSVSSGQAGLEHVVLAVCDERWCAPVAAVLGQHVGNGSKPPQRLQKFIHVELRQPCRATTHPPLAVILLRRLRLKRVSPLHVEEHHVDSPRRDLGCERQADCSVQSRRVARRVKISGVTMAMVCAYVCVCVCVCVGRRGGHLYVQLCWVHDWWW